jgi:uncharacterized damage-inducible protein DinB
MSKAERIGAHWQDVRDGFIREVELIPAEQMGFKPAAESRSVIEVLQHVIESQRMLVGEMCRDNTNFQRGFPALQAEFGVGIKDANNKDSIVDLLRSSFAESKATIVAFGDENFEKDMTRFDGKVCSKFEMLNFAVSHEMYHRGQFTVYERLLGVEPALTQFFKKMMSASS